MADDLSTSDMQDGAKFTDLNSPVDDSSGTSASNEVYPIADPSSLSSGTNPVQGFSVGTDLNVPTQATVPGNVAGVTSNPLPMPVRWLYKLQDGTLVAAPTGGATGTVNLSGLGASASNPIVGRIAFWTDDESSKVNINTAGEGTYWDTPRFWGNTQGLTPSPALTQTPYPDSEYALAISQPAQYEFQRYPGHPAQVALSPIFPSLIQGQTASQISSTMANITPFLAPGGSEGGTFTIENEQDLAAGVLKLTGAIRQSLYATTDDFLYGTGVSGSTRMPTSSSITPQTLESAKFFITANSRAPELNLYGMPRIACWPISQDFNLETNPQSAYTSVFDRLIAFCSSLKTAANTYAPYYFQRWEPNDPNYDFTGIPGNRNPQLYSYLQSLTNFSIPGFGSSLDAKYPADRDQILTEIFDYIRCTDISDPALYSATAPPSSQKTFAVTLEAGSAGNFDNLTYPITPIQINGNTMGFGRSPVINQVAIGLICIMDGSRMDYGPGLTPSSTNANASISTPYQDTATPPTFLPAKEQPVLDYASIMSAAGLSTSTQLPTNQRILQAAFFMQGYMPSSGPPQFTPNFYMSVTGLGKITFNGSITPFTESVTDQAFCCRFYGGNGVIATPEMGPVDFCFGHDGDWDMPLGAYTYTTPSPPNASSFIYPCVSHPFEMDSSTSAITVDDANQISINMLPGNSSAGRLQAPVGSNSTYSSVKPYQTLTFYFPSHNSTEKGIMVMPNPKLDTTDQNLSGNPPITINYAWGFAHRLNGDAGAFVSPNNAPSSNFLWGAYDTVKGFFLAPHGDWRLLAASSNPVITTAPITDGNGVVHLSYNNSVLQYSHFMRDETRTMITNNPQLDQSAALIPNLPNTGPSFQNKYPIDGAGFHIPSVPWTGDPPSPGNVNSKAQYCYMNGDFDNTVATWADGPAINKPDEGDSGGQGNDTVPYVADYLSDTASRGVTFFTPNRIMPSPGMFGSLPTGVISGIPWQTLLFRPQPTIGGAPTTYFAHSEAAVPAIVPAYNAYTNKSPDHLFLDLFWMPIVEPYAISDSFSTAGKINMNYQIEPFSYIDRSTSLVCLLKSEKIISVPDTDNLLYKQTSTEIPGGANFRFTINPNETGGSLRQFLARFDQGDIFRSATEICDIFLVPNTINGTPTSPDTTWNSDSDAAAYWSTHRLTGDNSRERPYTNLYGRLTTKSNTFTIHMRVQSLKQSVASRAAGVWVEPTGLGSRDTINGEYRGSALIERYLDPEASTLPDYAANVSLGGNLDDYYKFRVVRTTQFVP